MREKTTTRVRSEKLPSKNGRLITDDRVLRYIIIYIKGTLIQL